MLKTKLHRTTVLKRECSTATESVDAYLRRSEVVCCFPLGLCQS